MISRNVNKEFQILKNRSILTLVVPLFLAVSTLFGCSQKKRTLTIGIAQWVTNSEYARNIKGFKEELAARGFKEGENVNYMMRCCEADKTKQRQFINEFKTKKVDLIYSLTTPGTLIAKEISDKIPIVFSIVTYPVESGVIKSLSSSGCNAVGTRNYVPPWRQYYVFERIHPEIKTIAFVHRKGEVNSTIQFNEFKSMLEPRGIRVVEIAAENLLDLKEQLEKVRDRIDAVYSACDTLIQSGGEEIVIKFSLNYRIPSFTCNKGGVLEGALAGNVADFYTLGKISGEKAGLILNGADPRWLQTESIREDYIAVNERTAHALNMEIPKDIMEQAKEIVRQ